MPSQLLIEADAIQIERVLRNLMDNAAKYTDCDGEVRVRARPIEENGRWVMVEVEDEGIGIPAPDVDHVFEKFYQGRNQPGRRAEGSGLGLYLCEQIVRVHGGHIWVHSTPGAGSVFGFKIPQGGIR